MIDEESCPICLEVLEHNNSVVLVSCKHVFCRSCVAAMVFKHKVSCPMDRSKVSLISDRHLRENNGLSIEDITINEYRDNIKKYEPGLIRNIIVQYLSSSFMNAHKKLNAIEEFLGKLRNTMSEWLTRNTRVSKKEISDLGIHDTDFDADDYLLPSSTLFESSDMYVSHSVDTLDYQLSKWKSINEEINFDPDALEDPLTYLTIPGNEQMTLLETIVKRIEPDIVHIGHIRRCITSMAIAVRSEDRDIFREIQPNVAKDEKHKCLICAESISDDKFAMFVECDHKLCLTCIERFFICHGNCPFHCDQSANLESIITHPANNLIGVMKPILMNDGVETVKSHIMKNIDNLTRNGSNEIINWNINSIITIVSSSFSLEIIAKEFAKCPSEMNSWAAIELTLKTCRAELRTYFRSLKEIKTLPPFQNSYEKIKNHCLLLFLCDTTDLFGPQYTLGYKHTLVERLLNSKSFYGSFLNDMLQLDKAFCNNFFIDVVTDTRETVLSTIIELMDFRIMSERFQMELIDGRTGLSELYTRSMSVFHEYLKSNYSKIYERFHINVLKDLNDAGELDMDTWPEWMKTQCWMHIDNRKASDGDVEMDSEDDDESMEW